MTDDQILDKIGKALFDLNKGLDEAAKQGIIVNINRMDLTAMEHRVRGYQYSFTADKRLVGGLDL